MHPTPTTPLGQAFAAIIAMLIAAIAEHAVQHPMLAPMLHATIKQLEDFTERFEAMVQAWEAGRPIPDSRPAQRRGTAPQAIPMPPQRPRDPSSRRPCAVMWHRLQAARAPPRRPFAPAPTPTPPASPPRGAERMYAGPTP